MGLDPGCMAFFRHPDRSTQFRLDYDPDHRWYALETAGAIARAARLELPSECAPHQRVWLVLDCIRETCGSLAHPILRLR
jgi:hypothetical protein